jgi:hypothetical protein
MHLKSKTNFYLVLAAAAGGRARIDLLRVSRNLIRRASDFSTQPIKRQEQQGGGLVWHSSAIRVTTYKSPRVSAFGRLQDSGLPGIDQVTDSSRSVPPLSIKHFAGHGQQSFTLPSLKEKSNK